MINRDLVIAAKHQSKLIVWRTPLGVHAKAISFVNWLHIIRFILILLLFLLEAASIDHRWFSPCVLMYAQCGVNSLFSEEVLKDATQLQLSTIVI